MTEKNQTEDVRYIFTFSRNRFIKYVSQQKVTILNTSHIELVEKWLIALAN